MSNDELVVSEIMPSLYAFAAWINAGADPASVPHVAFSAGWQARDAEIAAAIEAQRLNGPILHGPHRKIDHRCMGCELILLIQTISSAPTPITDHPAAGRTVCPTCSGAGTVVELKKPCAGCGAPAHAPISAHRAGCWRGEMVDVGTLVERGPTTGDPCARCGEPIPDAPTGNLCQRCGYQRFEAHMDRVLHKPEEASHE